MCISDDIQNIISENRYIEYMSLSREIRDFGGEDMYKNNPCCFLFIKGLASHVTINQIFTTCIYISYIYIYYKSCKVVYSKTNLNKCLLTNY